MTRIHPNRADAAWILRLVTANLLYRTRRAGPFLDLVASEEPDLLLLQELTPSIAEELRAALAASHPHALLDPDEAADGFGVFARWPVAPVDTTESGGSAAQGALLARGNRYVQRSLLSAPGGPIALFNTHLVSPLDADAMRNVGWRSLGMLREAQAEAIARQAAGAGDAIVAGDLNAWPGRPAPRAIAGACRDAWTAGAGAGGTWPRRVPWLPLPALPVFRLDYCFVGGALAPRRSYVLRQPTGSDHCPLVVHIGHAPHSARAAR